jgi:type I restriction enzyme S subunit
MASGWALAGAGHGGGGVSVAEKTTQEGVRGRFKPYPAYKDSGVEWLGEIPEHWDVKRLRSSVKSCQNGVWGDEPDGLQDIACVRVADFDRVSFRVNIEDPTLRSIEPKGASARGLRQGDLLLEKSGGGENQPVGAVVLYDHVIPAVCSNFVARVVLAKGFDSRFMTYLHAALYSLRINTRYIKQSTGIQNLDSTSYLDEAAGFPSESEQCAIATFLGRETSRIDAMVAKKRRLIELLQEHRTALITRAATKGLDPAVPMKDSGVEWLGEIPEHWEVAKTWRLFSAISGGTPAKDEAAYWEGEMPWVSPKDMKRRFIETSEDMITELALAETGVKLIPNPSILMVVRGMILAHTFPVAITTAHVTINQDMKALQLRPNVAHSFIAWLFEGIGSALLGVVVEAAAHGTKVIRMDKWHSVELPVPPTDEQSVIAKHLDRQTAQIDYLISRVRDAIKRLEELRTALISAAVTGKIDVREEVV